MRHPRTRRAYLALMRLWHDRITMRQLSESDALLLASESAHAGSNVSLVQIYDPSTAPGGKLGFKHACALVESRLHRSPIFRQKLRGVPFALDGRTGSRTSTSTSSTTSATSPCPSRATGGSSASRPRASTRVRSIATARCGSSTSSRAWTACSTCRSASFALLTKLHHAAIDVERGTEIMTLLHDTTPRRRRRSRPSPGSPIRHRAALELVAAASCTRRPRPRGSRGPSGRARARRRCGALPGRRPVSSARSRFRRRASIPSCRPTASSRPGGSCSTSSGRSAGSCPARR